MRSKKKNESRLSGKIMFPSNYKNCPVSMYLSVLYFFWFQTRVSVILY